MFRDDQTKLEEVRLLQSENQRLKKTVRELLERKKRKDMFKMKVYRIKNVLLHPIMVILSGLFLFVLGLCCVGR